MVDAGDPRGAPSFDDIERARDRLVPLLAPTPLLTLGHGEDAIAMKAENLQRTGSFKIRGAYNRIARLEGGEGVVAASAGNHAQGVALAASMKGLAATIVMPEETPLIKVERTQALGAEILLHGDTFEDAYKRACEEGDRRGLTLVHAYEDRDVIAGQGTIGLEILEQYPGVEMVVVPVGGGGLISGIALAIKSRARHVKVVGVQAEGAAPTVEAFRSGVDATGPLQRAETIADAIRFKRSSDVTMPIIRAHVDAMVTVTEDEIAASIVRLMEDSKLVVEGAGAVGIAALVSGKIPDRPEKVCAVVSGGNLDPNLAARIIEQGLSRADRYLVLRCRIPDRPGRLFAILAHLAERKINVMDVRHNRAGWRIPLGQVEVELLLETRNAEHAARIIASLEGDGYRVERADR